MFSFLVVVFLSFAQTSSFLDKQAAPQGLHNYGLYLTPQSASQPGGFFEEHRKLLDYRLANNTELMLKLKARDTAGKSEKELAKLNTKKQQQAFMQLLTKKSAHLVLGPFVFVDAFFNCRLQR